MRRGFPRPLPAHHQDRIALPNTNQREDLSDSRPDGPIRPRSKSQYRRRAIPAGRGRPGSSSWPTAGFEGEHVVLGRRAAPAATQPAEHYARVRSRLRAARSPPLAQRLRPWLWSRLRSSRVALHGAVAAAARRLGVLEVDASLSRGEGLAIASAVALRRRPVGGESPLRSRLSRLVQSSTTTSPGFRNRSYCRQLQPNLVLPRSRPML